MTDLLLQPTGDPDDYEVVVEGQVVGRIVLLAGAWSWAIDTAFRPGRHPVYGFEPTRDAAMQRSREAGFSTVKPELLMPLLWGQSTSAHLCNVWQVQISPNLPPWDEH
jgi:hypothetical protein